MRWMTAFAGFLWHFCSWRRSRGKRERCVHLPSCQDDFNPAISHTHTHKTHSQVWFSCCSGDKVWGHLINLKSWTQTWACKWRIIEHSSTADSEDITQHRGASRSGHWAVTSDLSAGRNKKIQLHGSVASRFITSHLLARSSPRGRDTRAEHSCALTGLPSAGKPVTFWLNGLLNIVEYCAHTMCSTTFWTRSAVEYKLAAFGVSILHYWERFGLLCC